MFLQGVGMSFLFYKILWLVINGLGEPLLPFPDAGMIERIG